MAQRHSYLFSSVFMGVVLSLGITIFSPAVFSGEHLSQQKPSVIHLQRLNQKYRNAMVRVEITPVRNIGEIRLNPEKKEELQGSAHGSGFFIAENEIVTNAHVVFQAKKGSIRIQSPSTGSAEFAMDLVGIGIEGRIDLALLRFQKGELERFKMRSGLKKIPVLRFGDSSSVRQSDRLAIFGYPLESDELKVIQAEVTGRHYHSNGFANLAIRHQFIEVGPGGTVQPGNSGGPALNAAGRIVGIPTLGNWRGSQGWLIPSNTITAFLDRIRDAGLGDRPMPIPVLGLVLKKNSTGASVLAGAPEDVSVFELGVGVKEVLPEGQGKAFGVREGDIIVGFENRNRKVSCALDYEGYRVVTGKMAKWPIHTEYRSNRDKPRLHLEELFFMANQGDEVKLTYLRPSGEKAGKAQWIEVLRKIEIQRKSHLQRLSIYQRPAYARWGDIVLQTFNNFNVEVFDLPEEEQEKGGLLVTYVGTGGVAEKRGFGGYGYRGGGGWMVLEAVNGAPVRNLDDFRLAIASATRVFDGMSNDATFSEKLLMKERYVRFKARIPGKKGEKFEYFESVLPIDDGWTMASQMEVPPADRSLGEKIPVLASTSSENTPVDLPSTTTATLP